MKRILCLLLCLFALVCLAACGGAQTKEPCATCKDADLNHKCDVCGERTGYCADTNADHFCDVCRTTLSECTAAAESHKCDFCGKTLSKYADANNDFICDVCGETHIICADENNDHKCDVCEETVSNCADWDFDHICDICEKRISKCTDSEPDHFCDWCYEWLSGCRDWNDDDRCDLCGDFLGDCSSHVDANHDLMCDVCGVAMPCTAHVDANHDLICDTCKAAVACTDHADKNQDLRCDYCKTRMECTHPDADEDGLCIVCYQLIKCMRCVDLDHDLKCDHTDICDKDVVCTKHADADENYACDWCGVDYSCPLSAHTDYNQDDRCDGCLLILEFFDFPWSSGTLTFEMTDHSNGQELPSGCKNWMAGETAGTASMTELAVKERNEAAYTITKVKVEYEFLPDNDPAYSWSKNYTRIYEDTAKGCYSDMYCNFVYDLVGASLQGCFANLKTSQYDNYFEFVKADKQDIYGSGDSAITDQEGYMYEYMTSLSIDSSKMYLLASDYFIDLIRAYYCVPVNVAMLNELADEDILGLGRTNTITDFAQAVKDGEWDYDLLMKYCAKFQNSTVNSDKKGFAIAQHSLSSAGLLYTSSISLFNDERNISGNSFVFDGTNSPYSYAETNETLFAFAEALEEMVQATGVVRFTKSDNAGLGSNLLGIREQFTTHRVLFGGVILLGSLEYHSYQEMKAGDGEGFLVVPVPLYTEYNEATGNVYNTQIHNVGRIGAISVLSENFDKCSAFLNYQSTRSRNVRDTYYNYDLLYSVVGGDSPEILQANWDMLNLLRDSVRSGFDKAYEDANALFNPYEKVMTMDGEMLFINLKWHDIMDRGSYLRADSIRTYYYQLKPAKEAYMKKLFLNGYTMLPN